jgi:protoheme IX farnesyltransferase
MYTSQKSRIDRSKERSIFKICERGSDVSILHLSEVYSAKATNIGGNLESSIYDFVELTKPSVTLLVVLSSITGMILANGEIHPITAIISTIATALGSASAAVFNMWYDRDIDALMLRTQKRPIVKGAVEADDAIVFSFILGIFAISLMAACVNYKSSFLLLFSILFYTVIYTMCLKRRTDQNIVIGGAAGSFPPIIGWMSVTDSISIEPIILFIMIFFWTPAHFWALAIYRRKEYAMCNVPMLPVTKGVKHTKKQILAYSIMTVIVSLMPYFIGMSRLIYLVAALFLGAKFIYSAYFLNKEKEAGSALKLFLFSITYLFLLFIILIIDHYVPITIT